MMIATCYDFYECFFLVLRFNSVEFFMVSFICLYLGSVPVERLETCFQRNIPLEFWLKFVHNLCQELVISEGNKGDYTQSTKFP
jgi:hypothetical protein